ncbi:hypothetical protein K9M74_02725 [Candidatus Woesearchaeota archaeon]|nr:hypothetical protein [Candidatus Woesearchaeota archaeon]
MSERMFFPLATNDGVDSLIADQFSNAPFFGLFDFETQSFVVIDNTAQQDKDNVAAIEVIVRTVNPTTIFVECLGQNIIRLFQERDIKVVKATYKTVREVIEHREELHELEEDCEEIK